VRCPAVGPQGLSPADPRPDVRRARSEPSGPLRLRALAAALPDHVRQGFRAGAAVAPAAADRSTTVFSVGMGGSAIAADLARGIVECETNVALVPVRSGDLPRAVERRSRVVLVSYSGDTWETLRAYETAGRSGASRWVLTSGGALAERAERDDVPIVTLPPGLPPRFSAGYIFGGLLGLLDPWFPESNEARVARATEALVAKISRFSRATGPAAAVARGIGPRFPFVYAESAFGGLARRWKSQIEENAKRLAVADELPELLHNAIVGWDATPARVARECAVVLLEWQNGSASTRRAFAHLSRLVARRGAKAIAVPLAPEDRLAAVLEGLSLGDHVSLFLADRRGVDPYPVEAIHRLKSVLSSERAA
jgi:glucose/mannose-6-phosphate isomerase